MIAYALFCVFAFSCDAFKLHVEGDYDVINQSYYYNYGFWRSQPSHRGSCHNYAEQGIPVDAAIRFGRFAGVLGAILGASLIMFLIVSIFVGPTPKNNNVGIIVAAVFMYVMALLNVLLLVGLALESCTEEDYIYCEPDLGYVFIPSMVLYIVAGIWMTVWWRREENTKTHHPTASSSSSSPTTPQSLRVGPVGENDVEAGTFPCPSKGTPASTLTTPGTTNRTVETVIHTDGSKTVTTTIRTMVVLDAHTAEKIKEKKIQQIPPPAAASAVAPNTTTSGHHHRPLPQHRHHRGRQYEDDDEKKLEEHKEEFCTTES